MRVGRQFQAIVLLCALFGMGLLHFQSVAALTQSDKSQIAREAVSLLQARCLRCHGEDKASKLDLRSRESLLEGGSRGAAVVVGKAEQSLLYQFISGNLQPRMPLGEQLSTAEIALLKQWIDGGAEWTDLKQAVAESVTKTERPDLYKGRPISEEERSYWAFRKPVRPPLPVVKNSTWVNNPIDAFVLARLEAKGLQPSAAADKRTLLRRVTFDLTGLPPTPEEIFTSTSSTSSHCFVKHS